MNTVCGDTLAGYWADITLHCDLPTDHHGSHEDRRLGKVIHWNQNNVWSTGRVA